jgi:hypothetical protein
MKTVTVLVSWSSRFWEPANISPAARFFCKDFARIGRRKHERDPRKTFPSARAKAVSSGEASHPPLLLVGGKIDQGRKFHSPAAFDYRSGITNLGLQEINPCARIPME